MAIYTLEIREILNNPLFSLFDFDYPFYCDSALLKHEFEQKFINHYYYDEIGCETFDRWNQMLKSRLTLRMPYYRQLYETELAAKDINFLLNKDLIETFERDIVQSNDSKTKTETNFTQDDEQSGMTSSNQQTSSTNTMTSSDETSSTSSNQSTSSVQEDATNTSTGDSSTTINHQMKESRLSDGVSDVQLSQGSLTGVSDDDSQTQVESNSSDVKEMNSTTTSSCSNETTSNSSNETETNDQLTSESTTTSEQKGQSTGQTSGEHSTENDSNLKEITKLISQGNIGVTSSAQLLKEWRQVLINIDEIIIKDCQDLFMQIY